MQWGWILLLFTFQGAQASSVFQPIRKPTNVALGDLYQTLKVANQPNDCMEIFLAKVVRRSPQNGRELTQWNMETLAESVHRYVTPWFEDGIDLRSLKGVYTKDVLENLFQVFERWHVRGPVKKKNLVREVLQQVIYLVSLRDFDIFAGDARGTNTTGSVIGFYDMKNKEVMSISISNFGAASQCRDH